MPDTGGTLAAPLGRKMITDCLTLDTGRLTEIVRQFLRKWLVGPLIFLILERQVRVIVPT